MVTGNIKYGRIDLAVEELDILTSLPPKLNQDLLQEMVL